MASAKNILVGASPLFLSASDSTTAGYVADMEPGAAGGVAFVTKNLAATPAVPATARIKSIFKRQEAYSV